ncbi:hypothetical protein [Streptomyces fractus]|uniref:hypothetical protein n=1 Tax=Streptomyces fractus TaxID=641806 RepID=UPI003CF5B8B4
MAFPAPVARLVRATAGRRALQLALLFGGLFVLGIVCGGRAQADGLPDAGSLRSGHVAVREHVADSARKLREAGSGETPTPSGAVGNTGAPDASGPSTATSAGEAGQAGQAEEGPKARAVEHASAPASAPAAPAPATVRPTPQTQTQTPNPVDARQAPGSEHTSEVRHLARPLHHEPTAPNAPTSPGNPTAPAIHTHVRPYLEALGGDPARLRSAVDALRYLTEPVGETVRQVTGPVEELATRAVAELVGAVPEQLTHGRLGGIIAIVDPADPRPETPAATTPQQPDTPAAQGDRHGAAEARSHAAPRGPQAYDVARFGDVEKTHAGARAEARPASPFVPQRPDGGPSAGTSVGDGGSSRHGDLHAAAFGGRAPVLLASGATASAGTAPVIDRLRDIPEFPG